MTKTKVIVDNLNIGIGLAKEKIYNALMQDERIADAIEFENRMKALHKAYYKIILEYVDFREKEELDG